MSCVVATLFSDLDMSVSVLVGFAAQPDHSILAKYNATLKLNRKSEGCL